VSDELARRRRFIRGELTAAERAAAKAAPEFTPHFSPEALDSMIDLVVKKTVATIRAREAALLRKTAQSD
jgi:hypothetical protein